MKEKNHLSSRQMRVITLQSVFFFFFLFVFFWSLVVLRIDIVGQSKSLMGLIELW